MSTELVGKQIQLLKEMVPKLSRVALLTNPANPASASFLREAEASVRALGVRLQTLAVRNPEEIDSAFTAMTRERAGALVILPDVLFLSQRRQIADIATKRHLPTVYGVAEYAEAGGLMAYGASHLDLVRRAATFVDKILKGAKPGDLPIEQPSKFELVINLKTAKAVGLSIPQSILLRADQVIE
jgi:putative ABC transport system substrate-binding protein